MKAPMFYVFGGMKSTQRTKLHIADENGVPLCNVKSFWMECFSEIFESGFIKGEEHLAPIQELDCTCKRCLKKFYEVTANSPKRIKTENKLGLIKD